MYDLIVIGGGPAGLAAACAAWEDGLRRILIVERDRELGGILNQCIHNGFGLHHFKEELTGPEYASRFVKLLGETGVEVRLDTMVLEVTGERGEVLIGQGGQDFEQEACQASHFPAGILGGFQGEMTQHGRPPAESVAAQTCQRFPTVHMVGKATGYRVEEATSIILAMGCRERTRGAVAIPGTRPAGVYTAGAAQRYVNMEGRMPGKRVVILGSGDIGLIMARRMTLEGAKVLACVELMPYSGGLTRNIVQCLHDYGIPLYLSHTVTEVRGKDRVEQVAVARVDENRAPIPGTEMVFDCDTLLLSVGLIPENELTRQAGIEIDPRTNGAVVWENMETSLPGVFACGNVAHVHDLVDFVTAESVRAGRAAAQYAGRQARDRGTDMTSHVPTENPGHQTKEPSPCLPCLVHPGSGVTYTVPQRIRPERVEKAVEVFFRVGRVCGDSEILVTSGERQIARFPREHLAPGEMERIVLPRVLLDRAEGEITVSVREK